MKYVDQLNLSGKRVLVRADLNVPLDDQGKIADDVRIRATIPTLKTIIQSGGRAIVCSHLGSPKGKQEPQLSLAPVAARLSELLGRPVKLAPDCIGPETEALAAALQNGEVLLLENLRFHAEEENNEGGFSQKLKRLADVYVNDAFGTAHRAHASTVGVVPLFEEKAGGLTMKSELEYFKQAFNNPMRPLLAIFGGVKISTKMAALRNVGKQADVVLVGGAMANTLLAAKGCALGRSLVEASEIENAKAAMQELSERGCRVVIPTDVVVANELKAGVTTKIKSVNELTAEDMALDIGPQTLELFRNEINKAGTIIWNGPMGAFETQGFHSGTFELIQILANCQALTVVGGGDTDLALHETHSFEKMGYVSTGGGAFLKLLEGKVLPAVAALGNHQ